MNNKVRVVLLEVTIPETCPAGFALSAANRGLQAQGLKALDYNVRIVGDYPLAVRDAS